MKKKKSLSSNKVFNLAPMPQGRVTMFTLKLRDLQVPLIFTRTLVYPSFHDLAWPEPTLRKQTWPSQLFNIHPCLSHFLLSPLILLNITDKSLVFGKLCPSASPAQFPNLFWGLFYLTSLLTLSAHQSLTLSATLWSHYSSGLCLGFCKEE